MNAPKNSFAKSRIEAFSDGVFAIIVTLLVLEIKVPHLESPADSRELLSMLTTLAPKFASWVISFFTVAVIWVSHHRLFKIFQICTNGLFWWNALLLMWCSFIPFPTAVMGDYPENHTAIFLYGLVMMAMSLTFVLMRLHALKYHLLNPQADRKRFSQGTRYSFLFGTAAYFTGILVSFVHPYLSFVIYLGIAVYFIFPHATEDLEFRTQTEP